MRQNQINQANWEEWRNQNRIEQTVKRQERFQKIERVATTIGLAIMITGGALILIKVGRLMVVELEKVNI